MKRVVVIPEAFAHTLVALLSDVETMGLTFESSQRDDIRRDVILARAALIPFCDIGGDEGVDGDSLLRALTIALMNAMESEARAEKKPGDGGEEFAWHSEVERLKVLNTAAALATSWVPK